MGSRTKQRKFQKFSQICTFSEISGMNFGISEARSHLAKLLRLAENGELVVITRNGKPSVRLHCVRVKAEPKNPDDEWLTARFAELTNFKMKL
jgi:prevent-host-death family protein